MSGRGDDAFWRNEDGSENERISRENRAKIAPKRKPTQRNANEEKTREKRNMGEIDDARKAQVELEGFFHGVEPEALPRMIGPITLKDGTVVVPHDPVERPAHYQSFGVEVIDIIRHALGPEGFRSYCIGNELKYRLRAGDKGDAAQDLAKAMKYREFRETK